MTAPIRPWTVFLGNGIYSHAVADRQAAVTVCGRSLAAAREWQQPGNDPGCHACFHRLALAREAATP